VPELDPAIRAYYERGEEAERLRGGFPSGPLEFERTKELILRWLPPGKLRILDVGGAAGIHAAWLVELGHQVRLIDPVPLHVEQAAAAHPRLVAELGDARALMADDGSCDVVLLLGPLYHLLEADDRQLALREAHRALRPGGQLFAAAISRSSALLDLLVRLDRLHEPSVLEVVTDAVQTGEFRGAQHGLFTHAYFHRPSELRAEVVDAGFVDTEVLNVEGPGFLIPDFARRWADPQRRRAMLEAARLIESDPEMLGAAGHLLAVARRP
jgi:SAM-dependent methyltransferase